MGTQDTVYTLYRIRDESYRKCYRNQRSTDSNSSILYYSEPFASASVGYLLEIAQLRSSAIITNLGKSYEKFTFSHVNDIKIVLKKYSVPIHLYSTYSYLLHLYKSYNFSKIILQSQKYIVAALTRASLSLAPPVSILIVSLQASCPRYNTCSNYNSP